MREPRLSTLVERCARKRFRSCLLRATICNSFQQAAEIGLGSGGRWFESSHSDQFAYVHSSDIGNGLFRTHG